MAKSKTGSKQVTSFSVSGEGVAPQLREDFIEALDGFIDDDRFRLRDDQPDCYQDLISTLHQDDPKTDRKKEAGMYSLPTGTGKTALYTHIARAALNMPERERADGKTRKPRVLVVVPTTDLLMQSALEFNKFFPELVNDDPAVAEALASAKKVKPAPAKAKGKEDDDLLPESTPGTDLDEQKSAYRQLGLKERGKPCRIGVVYGGNPKRWKQSKAGEEQEQIRIGQDREIIITTYDSLMAESNKKLFKPENFEIVILDEAHMGMEGNKPQKVKEFKGHSIRVGLSATPKRDAKNDAISLTDGNMIREVTLDQAHGLGAVCDFNVWQVKTGMEITLRASDIKGKGDHRHVDSDVFAQRLSGSTDQALRRGKVQQLYLNWNDPETGERLFGKTGVISALNVEDANGYETALNDVIYGAGYQHFFDKYGRPPKT